MKSVLISIRPKWCDLIAKGEKTIDVRKTHPKLQTPFRVYIYRTKGTVPHIINGKWVQMKVGGTVIGEFICDKVYELVNAFGGIMFADENLNQLEPQLFRDMSCLTDEQTADYFGDKDGYGLHITDLKIYDKPRELSEFWAYNEELHKRYDSERDFCCYDDTNEHGESLTDCGDAYNNILNCYRCWEEWSGWCHHVTRPPQSWCYVEELE